MNFQYLEDLDCEFLASSFDLKETVSNEEKEKEIETSSKGLTLKELRKHLKYAFLGPEKAKHVIISDALTELEEKKMLEILRKYNEEIVWSIEDLKGISPSICMHQILLKENEMTSIEHQRRLNPIERSY